MEPSIADFFISERLGPWCRLFHHTTEYFTMGTFTTPTIARIALARSARCTSSNEARNAMYPRYRNSRINSDVRRGSHSHQVPHMGLPQMEPVSSASTVKTA